MTAPPHIPYAQAALGGTTSRCPYHRFMAMLARVLPFAAMALPSVQRASASPRPALESTREPDGTRFPGEPRHFYRPSEIDALPADHPDLQHLQSAMAWIRNFIMKPHPTMGRKGAVCPYVKTSMDEDLFYVVIGRPADSTDPLSVAAELEAFGDAFRRMSPQNGPLAELRAFVVIFPETPPEVQMVMHRQKVPKTSMMQTGVMIGEFIPKTQVGEVLKSKFFGVEPPVPMYSVRTLIESDWEFLKGEADWRDAYHLHFPPQ